MSMDLLQSNFFQGRRVLLTGGSGFIGSHLARRLVEMGARLTVTTKYNSIIDNVRLAPIWEKIQIAEADLRNLDSVRALVEFQPEFVFHLAAYNHVGDSFIHVQEALNSNLMGTAHLLESVGGFERFVYVSTSESYGFQESVPFVEEMTPYPISPYAIGKYSGELYARMKAHVGGLPIVSVRPFNAFGPYQSQRAVVSELIYKCLMGEPIVTTEGIQTREFNFVDNLVDGMLLAAMKGGDPHGVYNIGSGEEISIRDLIQKIHQLTGARSELRIGSIPYRPTEIWRMKSDSEKSAKTFGWSPRVSLDQGLERTVEWYRRYIAAYCADDAPLRGL